MRKRRACGSRRRARDSRRPRRGPRDGACEPRVRARGPWGWAFLACVGLAIVAALACHALADGGGSPSSGDAADERSFDEGAESAADDEGGAGGSDGVGDDGGTDKAVSYTHLTAMGCCPPLAILSPCACLLAMIWA